MICVKNAKLSKYIEAVPTFGSRKTRLTDYLSDQGRGTMWGGAKSNQKDDWTKPNKTRHQQSTLQWSARCAGMCERLHCTQGLLQKPRNGAKFSSCFAHIHTGREQEGPLGWSDQLHNADTFSLTSVKLAKKRRGVDAVQAWVLKKIIK